MLVCLCFFSLFSLTIFFSFAYFSVFWLKINLIYLMVYVIWTANIFILHFLDHIHHHHTELDCLYQCYSESQVPCLYLSIKFCTKVDDVYVHICVCCHRKTNAKKKNKCLILVNESLAGKEVKLRAMIKYRNRHVAK